MSRSQHVKEILKTKGINELYHFTHVLNLPAILADGLRPATELRQNNRTVIWGNLPGFEARDQWTRRDQYVHLCFYPQHPMFYWRKREGHYCWLTFDVSLADEPNAKISDRNAADWHARVAPAGYGVAWVLSWDEINRRQQLYGVRSDEWKKPVQAELLVPGRIPPNLIRRIVCISPASRRFIERTIAGANKSNKFSYPQVMVEPSWFVDSGSVPFWWVEDFSAETGSRELRLEVTIQASGPWFEGSATLELLRYTRTSVEHIGRLDVDRPGVCITDIAYTQATDVVGVILYSRAAMRVEAYSVICQKYGWRHWLWIWDTIQGLLHYSAVSGGQSRQ